MLQRNSTNLEAKHLEPVNLQFKMFTSKEIKKLSVLKVTTPLSFNNFGHPLREGVYDPLMGPTGDGVCLTCNSNIHQCPGHFGHIELPLPVINPLFHKTVCAILKLTCFNCFCLQLAVQVKLQLKAKCELFQEGYFNELEELGQEIEMEEKNVASGATEAKVEYLKEVIKRHIEIVRNRDRFKTRRKDEFLTNTQSLNLQWQIYVDDYLKNKMSSGKSKVCLYCSTVMLPVKIVRDKILVSTKKAGEIETDKAILKTITQMVMPNNSKEYLRKVWVNESEILKILYPCLNLVSDDNPTDIFFFDVVPVLPPIVRPAVQLNNELIESPQTQAYKSIIHDCLIIRNIVQSMQDPSKVVEEGKILVELVQGKNLTEKLHNTWQKLQADVDHLMDREMNRNMDSNQIQGLKQIIEKKEGTIRMHMMGKRVNFAARSVITPDPNLNVDEIGIPEAFALKLTYPVPVTSYNVTDLRKMVINGPNIHPGAVLFEDEDGRITRLSHTNQVQREAIAKSLLTTNKPNKFFSGVKIVHRHLENGDILLLNRQPTLHKPSIMAHKARILKGEKTLRLHYANCKHYNSDFDGDEMNAHFVQGELSRSEGYFIANVSNQYLVPKDGTPLSGLIQDHIIGGVKMSIRGEFFNKSDYMNLVWSALHILPGCIKTLPPAILKPVPLWSGKQIISTVIINIIPRGKHLINLTSKSLINAKDWQVKQPRPWKYGGTPFEDPKTMSEGEVIIRKGELLNGILDKAHFGASSFGLVHCIHELYGGEYSSKLLSACGKLFQTYLQRKSGFTLGIKDILVEKKSDIKRKQIVEGLRKIGPKLHRQILQLSENASDEEVRKRMHENYLSDPKFREIVDHKYKKALNKFTDDISNTCIPGGLLQKFPRNNLQLMTLSGAKGGRVNAIQISCLLGQIALEGKRPPLMISGKSLPCYEPYDPSPMAGGFVDGRFLTGLKPQEFFHHCMAGREGLIDTAVKTSRSGYLQRCLIKHLEGLDVKYDMTVRDADGCLIQVAYGEDGLDVPNSRFLCKEQLEFLVENKEAIINKEIVSRLKEETNLHDINKENRKINKWKKRFGDPMKKKYISGFTKFCSDTATKKSPKYLKIQPNGRTKAAMSLMRKWVCADNDVKEKYLEEAARCPDPISSRHRIDMDFGVLPEKLESLITLYQEKTHSSTTAIKKSELKDLLCAKVQKAICPPGEAVGILAAQSIGEPSTQMTLNTFHSAGRGEMNVTLGIPRLREILMMASKNIKTPYMEIPFKPNLPNASQTMEMMSRKLTRCTLVDLMVKNTFQCNRKLILAPERRYECTIYMEFLAHKYYKKKFFLKPKKVLKHVEEVFFRKLFAMIARSEKNLTSARLVDIDKDSKIKTDKLADAELDYCDDDDPKESQKKSKLQLGELHESSDEEEVDGDADATVARTRLRHQENQEYDDPDEEEKIGDSDKEDEDDTENCENINREVNDDDEEINFNGTSRKSNMDNDRIKFVMNRYQFVLDYDYDCENNLWCSLKFWLPISMHKLPLKQIIQKVAESIVLWEIPGIKRSFVSKTKRKEMVLKTDGVNIGEIYKYCDILDVSRLYSNDIHEISQTYGIEAANRVIIKEIENTFEAYGITVNPRHLLLIADYMTFDGTFKPLNRKGMENSASPLQQMSFEAALSFLKNSTLRAKVDDLSSPSSRLIVGMPIKSGTGICDTLTDFGKYIVQM